MTEPYDCDTARVLLAELATSAATGHDRARALEHLANCPACREEMTQLARAADSLLLLAPRAEPSPGFEARVIATLEAHPPTATRPRRLAALGRVGRRPSTRQRRSQERPAYSGRRPRFRLSVRLATTVIIMLISLASGAAFAQSRGAEDRALAEHYRQTLQVANGRYLKATRLTTPDGTQVGTVFLYQGNPSWVLVTVTAAPTDGPYLMVLLDRDGSSHAAGTCHVTNRTGTAGYRLPIPVSKIAEVQLRSPTPTDGHLSART